MNQDYLNQSLTYTKDGRLLDQNGHAVMMDWEDEIMRHQAEGICQNGGDILNVGFGMGIIDTYIEDHRPRTHWIIEGHPDVQRKIIEDGWLKKPHVKVIFKPWQDVLHFLPKFDGVYFDTWGEDQGYFDANVQKILKPDGIYSFFNNPRGDEEGHHMGEPSFSILKHFFNWELKEIKIPHIDPIDTQRTDGGYYWHPNNTTYWNPICTLKQEFR
jgi:protein arginine N-methyltransferase 2